MLSLHSPHSTPASEYTEFTGNFPAIAAQCLQRLPSSNDKFTYNCDHHTFNFLVEDGYVLGEFEFFSLNCKWFLLDLARKPKARLLTVIARVWIPGRVWNINCPESSEKLFALCGESTVQRDHLISPQGVELLRTVLSDQSVETLKSQETKITSVQDDLAKVLKEKEALEAAVTDLTNDATQMKELCNDLEAKLQQSDDNFCKADSLLSQALANNTELEQKLKTLEELHSESGNVVTTTNQKNVELEDMVRVLSAAAEEAKSQLRESETRCMVAEQRSVELEQLLSLVELKSNDSERELRELSEKFAEQNAILKKEVEQKEQLNIQLQENEDKIAQIKSDLGISTARNSDLELELKNAMDKCAEHEGRANTTHQRSIELEDLVQTSHVKATEADKKVSELELLLETEKYRIKELEEQISTLEKKCGDVEEESLKSIEKVSELEGQLEASQLKTSSLEVALQAATGKEKELTEHLHMIAEENRNLKDASKTSNEKLSEAENLVDILRNELSISQQKLESIENDVKAAGMRENEVIEKLKSAEEQLEEQRRVLEKATTRSTELESLHETLTRDSEKKLQEALSNFSSRDLEAKSLNETLTSLEDQVKNYQEQLAEANERYEAVKEELDLIIVKLASSENANENLKQKIFDAEGKAEQYVAENELLADTNLQLSKQAKELEEKLNLALSEKEVSDKQLASHMSTITELTEGHSIAPELQLAAEARISGAEAQLEEALLKVNQRDSEAKDFYEKLKALEEQVQMYEEKAQETSTLLQTREGELEQTLLKLKDLESEVEEKSKLTQELASHRSKLNDLETKLSTVSSEKNDAVEELQSAKKDIEDLTHKLASEGQRLQSQISSVMEENNLLNETNQSSKKELQTIVVHLEEQLKEQNSRFETLNTEVGQKAELQSRLKELEEHLAIAEARVKEEVMQIYMVVELILFSIDLIYSKTKPFFFDNESSSQKKLEQEASLKQSFEELDAKNKTVLHLENQVKELEQKLQLADSKLKEKVRFLSASGSPAHVYSVFIFEYTRDWEGLHIHT
ncbi:LOW QUALITY PROTEIN: myosin-9-like [Olea europaea var. sylvestris]|uniref:LOW QUALITY PROTEIN: myosin-9-like n=1 Tax=Olea europaea var. sylvestris TaxID=158386 RepID=UPI000C1D7087|nr:LOW QUALITY PROTEIN: myosin-9-like [Olea europaea var. sylvestris]